MFEQGKNHEKVLGRLTLAVWALVVVTIIQVCVSITLTLYPFFYINRYMNDSPSERSYSLESGSIHSSSWCDEYEGFYEWPLEKQIETASVIILTRYEKHEGRYVAVVEEIIKQTPGAKFYYNIGDIYYPGSFHPDDHREEIKKLLAEDKELSEYLEEGIEEDCFESMEAEVVFFVGSPASMRYSTSVYNNRIAGFGDMPLEVFRDLVKATLK